ncbi:MAG: NAD(P)-dependent oxidoreductase [Anaerolineae bacterium]|nr:NAD(P)-dependent oxidoreductase [Anaerolineae bacterium]
MKVLVTGGTGNVGRAAVWRLVENGHQVTVIGRRPDLQVEGATYKQCDITDFPALREHVRGMEGIVHLAAIPYPGGAPGQEVFRVNCSGTYNVYRAAADEGIPKLASASSINALGYNYGRVSFPIQYFPIDEDHPSYTTDSYSFSKEVVEQIGDYFWRREGISSVNLRLPGVYEFDAERFERMRGFMGHFRQAFEALMSAPEGERRARVRAAIARFDASRPERSMPMPREEMHRRWAALRDDPDMALLWGGFGRSNFWASIDARDSAQAFEAGLLAEYTGSHPLYVNDSHNAAGIDSETLVQVFFPEVEGRAHPLQGTETLVSIDRARAVLGFEPAHSAREWFD